SIISLSEQYSLIYNAFTDHFIVFKSQLADYIQKDRESLQRYAPELHQKLVDSFCYVEDDRNEWDHLNKFTKNIIEDDSNFTLIINPTMACNFKCWYCYENHLPKSKMTKSIQKRIEDLSVKILESNKNLKQFALAFFGGEPLLQFDAIVKPLIEFHSALCSQNNIHLGISFTSNGSLITPSVIDYLKKYEDVYFQITLDGGESHHNKVRYSYKNQNSYQLILENIRQLLSNRIPVRLRINYTIKSIDSIQSILPDIQDISMNDRRFLEIDFHRVWQDRETLSVPESIRDVINMFVWEGFTVIFNDIDEIRKCCYADKRHTCVINYNGDVYKCTAKDFTKENREGYLKEHGEIVWENSPEYRANLKLKLDHCKNCRVAPLCGGGCSRHILEQEKEGNSGYCALENSEEMMDQMILDRFDACIRTQEKVPLCFS
ncbi:MAG: radical SAM protein, partial [Bacteroidales bacterium]|nr:radical SAM protein [Bacteroidales bacterium]